MRFTVFNDDQARPVPEQAARRWSNVCDLGNSFGDSCHFQRDPRVEA
jgi:hypothetical protein